MDLHHIPFFQAVHQQLGWLEQRQEVLAQNVANADTPDFRPSDLKPLEFHPLIGRPDLRLELAGGDPGHQAGRATAGSFRDVPSRRTFETTPDGNAVVLEEQLAKVDQTEVNHRLVNELYRKHLGFFRIALGGR